MIQCRQIDDGMQIPCLLPHQEQPAVEPERCFVQNSLYGSLGQQGIHGLLEIPAAVPGAERDAVVCDVEFLSRPLSLERPDDDDGHLWSLLWRWGECRRTNECLEEPRSLEWWSLRQSSSLDLDGCTTCDWTPPERLSVAGLSDLDFDLWCDDPSDVLLFFLCGPKVSFGAWISTLSSIASCNFLDAAVAFLLSFWDLAFSCSHDSQTMQGVCLLHSWPSTLLAALVVVPLPAKVQELGKLRRQFSRRWTPVTWVRHLVNMGRTAIPKSEKKRFLTKLGGENRVTWDRLLRVLSLFLTSLPNVKSCLGWQMVTFSGSWLSTGEARIKVRTWSGSPRERCRCGCALKTGVVEKFFVVEFSPGISWRAKRMQPLLRHA